MPDSPTTPLSRLKAAVTEAIASARQAHDAPARVSVSLRGRRGDLLSVAPDDQHDAASTMKLPVLIAAYRLRDAGRIDLSAPVLVHNDFASRGRSGADARFALDPEDDSDAEPWQRLGARVPLDWLCRRMIVRSSNLATDLVWEHVGAQPVAEVIDRAGALGVRVERAIGDFGARPAGFRNLVSTAGLVRILGALTDGQLAAPDTTRELLDVLAANEVGTDVRGGLPPGTWVAHKNGWISDTVLDAALVRPDDAAAFVLCVAISAAWPNEDAHALIRRIAAEVWTERHHL